MGKSVNEMENTEKIAINTSDYENKTKEEKKEESKPTENKQVEEKQEDTFPPLRTIIYHERA